jgi:probable phosphoglycerate mutase
MQGQLDSPLTERGIEQAELLSKIVETQDVTSIVSSSLGRAKQTSEIVSARTGLPTETDERIQEIDFGAFAGRSEAQLRVNRQEFWAEREQNKWEYEWPDGESYADAYRRTGEFVKDHCNLQATVVIAHQSVNRVLIGQLLDLETEAMLELTQPNNVVFKITDDGDLQKWEYGELIDTR